MSIIKLDNQGPESGEGQGPAARNSGLATASLVLALLGPYSLFLPGLILGVVSLIQIRRSGGKLVGAGSAIAGIAIPILVLVMLVPVLLRAREGARQASCGANLKQTCLALTLYAADYDETFPTATRWNQLLRPYIKNPRDFICPSVRGSVPDYAMNKSLGSVSRKGVKSLEKTVGIYESVPGINQTGGLELLPVPGRHVGGNEMGFADGHTKWYKDGNYSSIRWKP